jgi:hypothetical protein
LVAHLHFLPTHKPTLKNAKELPSQRTKTLQTMDNRATTDRTPAPNSTYKKLAVQWLNQVLCFVSSSVVADSFRLRNRQLLVAAKRYLPF